MSEADSIFRHRMPGAGTPPARLTGNTGRISGQREAADARIAGRWAAFLEHIWQEAADQGRDADAFVRSDAVGRTLRARLFTDATGDTSFAVTLSPTQLLEGDLRDLARRFIAAYIAAYDASWPHS